MINQEVGRLSRWISAITVVGLSLLGVNNDAIGQTGNIFLNSTGTGSASVLDPGNDDYITNSGDTFSSSISDESEEFDAEFTTIWHYGPEPDSDLQTGSTCGPTEIVDNPNTNEHAAYYRLEDPDDTLGNGDELLVFRIRIAANPGNAGYGYSILMDTDLSFGNTGPNADSNYTSGNPGFELEILYGSGNSNGTKLLDVDGESAPNQFTTLASYPTTQRHQRSNAKFSNCSGDPVFMDFYIDFEDLGISVNTPIRLSFATSTSPNSALGGSASDIGGVDDDDFATDDEAFIELITNSPVLTFGGGYECNVNYTTSNDTSLCSDDTITLSVDVSGSLIGVTFNWSTGATSSSIDVHPDTTTTYFVTITDSLGTCEESITVSVSTGNFGTIFSQDSALTCLEDSLIVSAALGWEDYVWSNQQSGSSVEVNSSGMYFVTVTDSLGCQNVDSILVSILDLASISSDTTICIGDTITIGHYPTGAYNAIFGNGADGVLAVSGIVYTDDVRTTVTGTNPSGQPDVSVSNVSGLSVGDEVLLITMIDGATSGALAGNYQFNRISAINGSTLVLDSNLANDYNSASNVVHQLLRVPNYTNVTVPSGATLTCHNWDGSTGGVLVFRATGFVHNQGQITASGAGYRGTAHTAYYRNKDGAQGEGVLGYGYTGGNSNGSNSAVWNGANANGGGGGTGRQDAGGGGGGSHGSYGVNGNTQGGHYGGTRGDVIGSASLIKMYMGGAGGEAGADEDGGAPGSGGNGGGIIHIHADSLVNLGTIYSNGSVGGNGGGGSGCGMGGGGGGAGGTILLSGGIANSGTIQATGGSGGSNNGCGGAGGAGGNGRIKIQTDGSFPSTTPSPFEAALPAANQGNAYAFNYLWSTGDTTSTILVSPSSNSTYSVTVSDGISTCSDSVLVEVNNPNFSFSQDTVLTCGEDSVSIDPGASWSSYLWTTGDTLQVLTAQSSGIYSLTVTDSVGCASEDSLVVSVIPIGKGSSDTVICINDSIRLSPFSTDYGEMCGTVQENGNLFLQAPAGAVFTSVLFASYGTPTGSCGTFSTSSCHASGSLSIVEGYLLGNSSATIPASNGVFGDPCGGTGKRLYVQAQYSYPTSINDSFNFVWSTGDTTSYIDVSPNTSTVYTVSVTDGIGTCVDTIDVGVSNPQLSALIVPTDCEATENGSIATTLTGGYEPYAYQWNTGDTSASISELGIGLYSLNYTDSASCSGDTSFVIIDLDTINPVALASQTTLYLDEWGEVTLDFNDVDSGSYDNCGIESTWISNTSFDCSDVGLNSLQLAVFDSTNNSDTFDFMVYVLDTISPSVVSQNLTVYLDATGAASITAAQVDNGSSDNCSVDSLYLDQTAFDCSETGVNVVTLTAVDPSGNSSSVTADITVLDTISPSVISQNLTVYLDATGAASITAAQVDNGSSDNCSVDSLYLDQTAFDCSETGVNVVTLTAVDPSGNSSSVTADITVLDTISPSVISQNLTVYLDATGAASITAAQVDNGSSDNCSVDSLYLDQTAFDCSETGVNVVTLTAVDPSGNSSSVTADITVLDTISPSVISQNLTVYLDATGAASITAAQVDNGSSDNCSVDSLYLDQTAFDCSETGVNVVTLTAVDPSGNSSSVTADITVLDTISPSVISQNLTVYLDATGAASITAAQVDNGSSDNCSVDSLYLDQTAFDCSETGVNVVTLTAVDPSGNSSSVTADITVLDTISPSVISQNLTVYLDATGAASITAAQVDNGSSDNCSVDSLYLDQTAFDCSETGVNVVTLTAVDPSGNSSSVTADITVLDTISPSVISQNLTVYLDATGAASITAAQVDNGSSDNCSVDSLYLDQTAFDCSETGVNVVTLTAVDPSGNSSSVTADITVLDTISPSVIAQNMTTYLDAAGNANITSQEIDAGSLDNCGIDTMTVVPSSFNCGDTGTQVVTLIVWDNNGNVDSTTAEVAVLDTISPFVVTNNVVVTLDPNGMAFIVPQDVDSIVSDACGIDTMYLSIDSFDCSNVGQNEVTLTVIDVSGNATSASVFVTIVDTIYPVASAQNLVVYLDSNGLGYVLPEQADSGSYDNCGLVNYDLSDSVFSCNEVGSNEVTFFVIDGSYNTDSIVFNVVVLDTIGPSLLLQDVTVALDNGGEAAITIEDVDLGSYDNCGIDTIYLDQTEFGCVDLGDNSVTVVAVDSSGNVNSAVINVQVIDTIAPSIYSHDTTLYLDQDGFAHITPEMLDDGTIDNCFIDSTYLAVSSLNCQHGDSTIVIFYARDQSGNIDSQEVMVNVVDTISPVIKCQESFSTCDTLVYFEAPDATDACGIQDIVQTSGLEPNSFFPEGVTTIVYQVIDVNGNESTCQFEVERYPLPVLKAPADTSVYFAEPIELNPKDSLVAYYMWEPSDFLDDPISEAPIARPTADIVYQVLGESVDGCLVRDEVSITVIHDINFAQAFSPNGDGVNDVFYIEGIDLYPNSVVYIVNRYGLLVYESVGYQEPWDGTYKGELMPVGSYFFVIDLGEKDGRITGAITIIR